MIHLLQGRCRSCDYHETVAGGGVTASGLAKLLLAATLFVALAQSACDGDPQNSSQSTTTPATSSLSDEGPVALTPIPASDTDRRDCPPEWVVYVDADGLFSICAPSDWSALLSPGEAGPLLELGTIGTTISIQRTQTSDFFAGITNDRCYVVSYWKDLEEISLQLRGVAVPACAGLETLSVESEPARGTFAEVELGGEGGYLAIVATENLDFAAEIPVEEVLETLRLDGAN